MYEQLRVVSQHYVAFLQFKTLNLPGGGAAASLIDMNDALQNFHRSFFNTFAIIVYGSVLLYGMHRMHKCVYVSVHWVLPALGSIQTWSDSRVECQCRSRSRAMIQM